MGAGLAVFSVVSFLSTCFMLFGFGGKTIPAAADVLVHISGPEPQKHLASNLQVLVWNVEKGKENDFSKDFSLLSANKDLILLQEFVTSETVKKAVSKMSYELATSFIYKDGVRAGAATGSIAASTKIDFQITPDTEPVVGTPKPTIFTEYAVQGGKVENLLVVNIHGMNRAGLEAFQNQLIQIGKVIAAYKGAVLWGGDFNTNSQEKMVVLRSMIKQLGMEAVKFQPDQRTVSKLSRLPLDHVFVRGVEVLKAFVPGTDVSSGSDHQPLLLSIAL